MVKVADGKYEVLHENGAGLRAEAPKVGARLWRNNVGGMYDETGRDLTGDGLVLALVQRVEELEEALRRIRDYRGDEKLPVRNSVAKTGIARAALDGPCGCACEPKKADPTNGLGLARFQAQFDDGDEE